MNSSTIFPINVSGLAPNATTAYVTMMDRLFTTPQVISLLAVLGLLMLFGIFANAITFLVISGMKKTVFNVFIMSLCVSDFVSACNCPFMIYRALKAFDDYRLPEFLCKFALGIDFWTTISTIQHILLFSLLRLACIAIPIQFKKMKIIHSKITVVLIWIETFLVGFILYVSWPGVQVSVDNPASFTCKMQRTWAPLMFKYAMFGFPILIYAPVVAVVLSCLCIAGILIARKRRSIGDGRGQNATKQNFALLQLTLIIVSFLTGYSADSSYRLTAISAIRRGSPLSARTEVIYSIIAHSILRLSECLNPIFYNFGSSELRKATKTFLTNAVKKMRRQREHDSHVYSSRKSGSINVISNSTAEQIDTPVQSSNAK